MDETGSVLERCVGDKVHFLTSVFGRQYQYKAALSGSGYSDLLDVRDIDSLFTQNVMRVPAFRVVSSERGIGEAEYTKSIGLGGSRVDDAADAGKIAHLLRDGATLVINSLHLYWPPLTDFVESLTSELSQRVQVNAYLSPSDAKGLQVHHDTHDVIVLQVEGHKRFYLYEPLVEAPLRSQRWPRGKEPEGEPVEVVDMRPGDSLYIPRGVPHDAATIDEWSLHLTVGVLSHTGADVAEHLTKSIVEQHSALRKALPAGRKPGSEEGREAIASFASEYERSIGAHRAEGGTFEIATALQEKIVHGRAPRLLGRIASSVYQYNVGDAVSVRSAPQDTYSVVSSEEAVRIVAPDREIRLPARVATVLDVLLSGNSISVSHLETYVDESGVRVLLQCLYEAGVLDVEDWGVS